MDGFKERLSDAITDVCGTQSELARRIGVAPSTVSEWCRTNKYPSTFSLMLMCDELKVSADWLLFGYSDKDIIEDNKSLYEANKRLIGACLEAKEECEKYSKIEDIVMEYRADNPKEPMWDTEDYMNSIIDVLYDRKE